VWAQVRVCVKEAEQARDYNERVSAVWRLSKTAVMYKGALQVLLQLLVAAAVLVVVVFVAVMIMTMTAIRQPSQPYLQGASMLAMSGCVVMGLWCAR
jgi:hypothetical protein